MEIVARRLSEVLPGQAIESVMTPGINVLKTFDPPLSALEGAAIADVRRRGKLLLLEADTASHGPLTLLVHLMSAGRLMLYDKRGSLRDKTSRVLIRLPEDRELRLREFGTKQAAWIKLLTLDGLEAEDSLRTLGPEAWPDPPELGRVLDVYEEKVALPLPEKFPKPTRVHAHQGEPCPRCETVLEAVFYEDYVMTYCPHCQTGGRILKDRRLSRLLK
jgi:formamidopyrimidine-DNA glycosylase